MPRRKRRFEKELTSKGKASDSYDKLLHQPTALPTY
jgi:hypothetical protein